MGKRRIVWLVLICLLLTGCMQSGDDLLSPPKPPKDYLKLQNKLDKIIESGLQYAAPKGGAYRHAVQLIDLDADGSEEVISIFRAISGPGPFQIYLHKKIGEDYIEMGMVEGHGTTIEEVYYPTFKEDGSRGIVLCWSLGEGLDNGMTVCSFEKGKFSEIYNAEYSEISVDDFDYDSNAEIVTVNQDRQTGRFSAKLLKYEENQIKTVSEVSLSAKIKNVVRIKAGYVEVKKPAIFIDSSPTGRGLITDILVLDGRGLTNITMDSGSGSGDLTYRPISVLSADIDGDLIMEVPFLEMLPGYLETNFADAQWRYVWKKYKENAQPEVALQTYHNYSEEWYLILPSKWGDFITVSKNSVANINTTLFSVYEGEKAGDVVLELKVLSGDDREELYYGEEWIELGRNQSSIFIAKLNQNVKNSKFKLTEEELRSYFRIIPKVWVMEEFKS